MAKSVRRDLRRALGDEAIQTLADQEQAIRILSNGLATVQRETASIVVRQAEVTRTLTETIRHLDAVQKSETAALHRGFNGRFRWLFTGK